MLAMHITYANHGMGYHVTELPVANVTFIAKQLVAYQAVYYAAMSSIKISYLWFYLRIFPHQSFRKWIWVCMGLVAGYWAGSMLQIFLICSPFEMNWNPLAGGHCASYNVAFVTIGIFNMISDLVIMLLPIPFLRKLQMAIGTKIGLVTIFGIGLLLVITSGSRRPLSERVLTNIQCNSHNHNPHQRPPPRRLRRPLLLHARRSLLVRRRARHRHHKLLHRDPPTSPQNDLPRPPLVIPKEQYSRSRRVLRLQGSELRKQVEKEARLGRHA